MKYEITTKKTINVVADNEQDAIKIAKINQNDITNIKVILDTMSLNDFSKCIDNLNAELDRSSTQTEKMKKDLNEKEKTIWLSICQYLNDDIVPLLQKSNCYRRVPFYQDLFLDGTMISKELYLKIIRYESINDDCYKDDCYKIDHSTSINEYLNGRYAYDINVCYEKDFEPFIVRNWDIIKPQFEKNLIEFITQKMNERIDTQNQKYNEYYDLYNK